MKAKAKVIAVILVCLLMGCSGKAVIPLSNITYDSSDTNKIIYIEDIGDSKPVFELYGSGFIRRRANVFHEEMESGYLSKKQVKQLLNHIINKQRIGDLASGYPESVIPGIEMYPNPELLLEVRINGFHKQLRFVYSNVSDELEYFRDEERIDEETFNELDKLRAIFRFLMKYNISKEG
jgi:hypothetical protein